MRVAAVLSVLVVSVALPSFASPQDVGRSPGEGFISGVVKSCPSFGSPHPIAGVEVRLLGEPGGTPAITRTGPQGVFVFHDVGPGVYWILTSGVSHRAEVPADSVRIRTCRPGTEEHPAASLAAIKPGRNVTVTLTSGRTLQGRLVEVTPESLKLANGSLRTDVREEDVWMLESRSRSHLLGMFLGAVTPAGVAVLTKGCCAPLNTPAGIGILTAAGAGIGALVGTTTTELLFHRGSAAARLGHARVLPMLAEHRRGVAVALRW